MSEWWQSDDLAKVCETHWHERQCDFAIDVCWHEKSYGEQKAILVWLKENLNCQYNIARYYMVGGYDDPIEDGYHRFSFSDKDTAALFKLFCS